MAAVDDGKSHEYERKTRYCRVWYSKSKASDKLCARMVVVVVMVVVVARGCGALYYTCRQGAALYQQSCETSDSCSTWW